MTSQQKKRKLTKKADRVLQEAGRRVYKDCMVCGKPMTCLHHFFPKSMTTILRYDWENLIPICNGCHLQHHSGNPDIHARVIELKGENWLNDLRAKKLKAVKEGFKPTIKWLENKIEALEAVDK